MTTAGGGARPKPGELARSVLPDADRPVNGKYALIGGAIAVFGILPNLYLVFERIGPGAWLAGVQEHATGGYWPFLSALLLFAGELFALAIPLLLVQLTVRLVTGRTIREHLETRRLRRARRSGAGGPAARPGAPPRSGRR